MKLTLFFSLICFSLLGQAKKEFRIPVDSLKTYNVDTQYSCKELLEQSYFLSLKTTESYLVCESLIDIYEKFSGKELNGEILYNYLQERNFLLSWYGDIEDVEDTKTKVFKLSKDQLHEILNLK
jgi:hypothetical protein